MTVSIRYLAAICSGALLLAAVPAEAAAINGAVAATDSSCSAVNGSPFSDKSSVYLKPRAGTGGGASLPDGTYYVVVTDPSSSVALSAVSAPVIVTGGKFGSSTCVQLQSIVAFADTTNMGGEYKVSVSLSTTFENDVTKSDTFKVAKAVPVVVPTTGSIAVNKFYDAQVTGTAAGQAPISGWQVGIDGTLQTTPALFTGLTDPTYTAYENEPLGNSILNAYAWIPTNAYKDGSFTFTGPNPGAYFNSLNLPLAAGENATVYFGNVCIGPNTGAKSLGFWSNKNGQALLGQYPNWSAVLTQMYLVNPNGSAFDPTNYPMLRNWLLNGNATNMAYMLSVQLATLQLSVTTLQVPLTTMVYAPGLPDANPAGFISVGNLITVANSLLQPPGNTTYAGEPMRMVQEAVKNALDHINNNRASVAQPEGSNCPALSF